MENEEALALLTAAFDFEKDEASRKAAWEALDEMEKESLLSTLAYALGQESHRRAALEVIRDRSRDWSKDKRLAPFLAKCIRDTRGHMLYVAALTAKAIPDPVLLPSLIENALESEYGKVATCGGPDGHVEFIYDSVFGEVAEALYKITDGEIGLEDVRRDIPFPDEERKRLITEWKAWWEVNKPEEDGDSGSSDSPAETTEGDSDGES